MIGKTLSHYRILDELGRGGMGVVYKAEDTRLKRAVAVKSLPRHLAAGGEERNRFMIEAQAAAALNHPNIATIYGLEDVDGELFIVMEFIDGRELKSLIADGSLTTEDVEQYALQIAEGLNAAHEKGVTHRDVKSANIMVTSGGRVKIMDFGLAKMRGSAQITRRGSTIGTAAYMSPEQARGEEADARSDIWSFGVVLYEMLTGRMPFAGEYEQSVIYSILNVDPEPLASALQDTPEQLQHIVERALQKDVGKRVQSMQEILDLLNAPQDPGQQQSPARRQTAAKALKNQPSATKTAASDTRNLPTIVVLPFVNMSPDPENEYFSDGLTEEVISDLARLSRLRVISRNSAMALKGTKKDSPTLARELGVTHLVTGSVRRAGQALRVTADLVEATTDMPLWSDKFSGTVEDVFGIQEEISGQIVSALRIRLSDSELRQAEDRPVDDPIAYDCYMKARLSMYRWTLDGQRQALHMVEQAMGIVGETPLLLATAGQIHWNRVNTSMTSASEGLARATDFVDRALALDPNHALAIFVRGLISGVKGEPEQALPDLYRAQALSPGDSNIMLELCRYSNSAGISSHWRFVEELNRIDPLNPFAPLVESSFLWFTGPQKEAAAPARRSIEMAPGPSMLNVIAGWHIAEAGYPEEAAGILALAGEAMAGSLHGAHAEFLRFALEGNEAEALLHIPPNLEQEISNEFSCRITADAYALLGHREEALLWLRKAVAFGYIHWPNLSEGARFLESLRSDPEFQTILDEIKPRWEAVVAWEKTLS